MKVEKIFFQICMRVFVLLIMLYGCSPDRPAIQEYNVSSDASAQERLARAWRDQASGFMVEARAPVAAVLADDEEGSRHQRFIITLSGGQTILVSHNLDLASRVDNLKAGDRVAVYGQYEWNPKGGVIHWTHRDPAGRHPDGWIEHDGKRYE